MKSASVSVGGLVVSAIGVGLLVLVGVEKDDTDADAAHLAGKCARLRVFEDEQGKMNLSLLDKAGTALAVSQFTLLGDARKGNRPGFDKAMEPVEASRLFSVFVESLKSEGISAMEGVFKAHMLVSLVNDGPVTILLDTKKLF